MTVHLNNPSQGRAVLYKREWVGNGARGSTQTNSEQKISRKVYIGLERAS